MGRVGVLPLQAETAVFEALSQSSRCVWEGTLQPFCHVRRNGQDLCQQLQLRLFSRDSFNARRCQSNQRFAAHGPHGQQWRHPRHARNPVSTPAAAVLCFTAIIHPTETSRSHCPQTGHEPDHSRVAHLRRLPSRTQCELRQKVADRSGNHHCRLCLSAMRMALRRHLTGRLAGNDRQSTILSGGGHNHHGSDYGRCGG